MAIPGPAPREHVVVGNVNIDISVKVDRFPRPDENVFAREAWIGPGGAASNYSVAAARLGHRPLLVARAGEDALRLGILDYLRAHGVGVEGVIVAKGENTGTVVVIVVPSDSTRTMLTVRGANEGLTGALVPPAGDIVHFASVRGRIVEEASHAIAGRLSSYDPGGEVYRDPHGVAAALQLVGTLFLNDLEAARLEAATGVNVSSLPGKGRLSTVIVKLGQGGAVAYTRGGKVSVPPCNARRVVDATGAGDAFDAAFNYCVLEGCSIPDALAVASAAGSVKVELRGSSNMPSRGAIEERARECYGL